MSENVLLLPTYDKWNVKMVEEMESMMKNYVRSYLIFFKI